MNYPMISSEMGTLITPKITYFIGLTYCLSEVKNTKASEKFHFDLSDGLFFVGFGTLLLECELPPQTQSQKEARRRAER
jgi:hypothetical protein